MVEPAAVLIAAASGRALAASARRAASANSRTTFAISATESSIGSG